MGRPARRAGGSRRKQGNKQARGRRVTVDVEHFRGEPHAIIGPELAQQLGDASGSGSAPADEALRVERAEVNTDQEFDSLRSAAEIDLAREANAVPLPEGDNLSPDQPGAGVDGAAPGLELQPGGELTEEQAALVAERHRPMVGMLINTLADVIFPAWNITAQEREALTSSSSLALAYWWPDGTVPPKWAALAGVAFTGYTIANARRNDDGTWKPRKIVTVRREAGAGERPVEVPSAAPVAGGFSTSA